MPPVIARPDLRAEAIPTFDTEIASPGKEGPGRNDNPLSRTQVKMKKGGQQLRNSWHP
jgi:hypothetical protein